MAAKSVITVASVEEAHARGAKVVPVPRGAVVTPLARDVARRMGLRLETQPSAERRGLALANWKANGTAKEASARALAIGQGARAPADAKRRDVAVFAPFPHLALAAAALEGTGVALGAQDLSPLPPGASTGAVPAEMLLDLGCRYVLVGHSERRALLGDDEALVRKKLARALAAGLTGVLCVGETLAEREAGRTFGVLRHQLLDALTDLHRDALAKLVVAYEPVWAIGTGLTPTAGEVEAALGGLRDHLARRYDDDAAEAVRLLYGGSVTPQNAAELLAVPGCDGALVGGASLDPKGFAVIAGA